MDDLEDEQRKQQNRISSRARAINSAPPVATTEKLVA
jgi:hypothetical protein